MSDTVDIEELKFLALRILSGDIEPDITAISEILRAASDLYFNAEIDDEVKLSFLTDDEYDALERILRSLDSTNSVLSQVGSETRGAKIKLPYQMGSLDQVYDNEIGSFHLKSS